MVGTFCIVKERPVPQSSLRTFHVTALLQRFNRFGFLLLNRFADTALVWHGFISKHTR